jgi:hypothetical protein
MADTAEYQKTLTEALNARQAWLEKTELPKLKEELRVFHTSFASLYNLFLKRGLINEDPYKQDVKVGDISVPETEAFTEAERIDKLSIRLSNFDNQLDFLVNFFQISTENLSLEKIKRIVALVKYIDWVRFVPDAAASPNTKAVAEMVSQSKMGSDQISMSIIGEAQTRLKNATAAILGYLKEVSSFNREAYKLEVREKVLQNLSPVEAAQVVQIRKKYASLMPGKPFYAELIEEIIKEDHPREGPAFQEQVLKLLAVADAKPKTAKEPETIKTTLIDGLFAIGSVGAALTEISPKLAENVEVLENRRQSLWQKIRRLMDQMINKEPKPLIFDIEYVDSARGATVREKVNYNSLRADLERRIRMLQSISSRGGSPNPKMEAMDEPQLMALLEKNIREVQSCHKILSALDDYFKTVVDSGDRDKVKGIKPELATIKNAIVKANQKRYEYSAQKEEEEQFKRLGISSET